MSYLYGIRYKMEENDLILSLREVRQAQILSVIPESHTLP